MRRAEPVADGGLAFGQRVQVAHGVDAYGADGVSVLAGGLSSPDARPGRQFDARRSSSSRLPFALRFEGRKRKHDAAEYMATIAAERVVRHLERAGFVVMKKPPLGGHSALGRGFESR
jgi:hypothetical protein